MRTPLTSSALTGRPSGSSSGERSGSAGGWVSPRPSSTEPPRKSSPPTTATVRTKTTASSTPASGVAQRVVRQDGPHASAVVAGPPGLLGRLDHPHDLVDVVGHREQVQV